MKTSEIAREYNIHQGFFERYLVECDLNYKDGFFGGYIVDDADVEEYVKGFLAWNENREERDKKTNEEAEERKNRAREEWRLEEKRRKENVEKTMMTTGPSFEGYMITDYKGIVFDETITGVGIKTAVKGMFDIYASLTGEQLYAVSERINELKSELLYRLKEKAVNAGANAIIAIDFESSIVGPGGNTIMASAHGTAVVIEKIQKTE